MTLPNGALSTPTYPSDFLEPDDIARIVATIDYERGGIGLNNPSQGGNIKTWRARLAGSDVKVCADPFDALTEVVVTSAPDITELSLAFDQNMRPAIAYLQADVAKLYWFDTFLAAPTTTTIGSGISSVFLTMDDKRPVSTQVNSNDILLFYIRGGMLYSRRQRDRFSVESLLATLDDSPHLLRVGMGAGNRLLIEVGTRVLPGDESIDSLQRWKLPVQYVVPVTSALSSLDVVEGVPALSLPNLVPISVTIT